MVNGQPSGATIEYDPNATVGLSIRMPDTQGKITETSPIQDMPTNSALSLGHELIHADHIMSGGVSVAMADHDFREGAITFRENHYSEEFRTVGFGGFTRSGDITENQLRRELGMNPRAAYLSRPDWQQVTP